MLVLVNLAGNAVNFTDEGSVTLRVRILPDTGLQLEVEDTGIGMTPEEPIQNRNDRNIRSTLSQTRDSP